MNREEAIKSILMYLPEDQRDSAREKLANFEEDKFNTLYTGLQSIVGSQPSAAEAEVTQAPVKGPNPNWPKNDPMGNQVVGVTKDGNAVYQNSKGQYYFFTGRGGAAIIGANQFTPVKAVTDQGGGGETPAGGSGVNTAGALGALGVGTIGAGLGGYMLYKGLKGADTAKPLGLPHLPAKPTALSAPGIRNVVEIPSQVAPYKTPAVAQTSVKNVAPVVKSTAQPIPASKVEVDNTTKVFKNTYDQVKKKLNTGTEWIKQTGGKAPKDAATNKQLRKNIGDYTKKVLYYAKHI